MKPGKRSPKSIEPSVPDIVPATIVNLVCRVRELGVFAPIKAEESRQRIKL